MRQQAGDTVVLSMAYPLTPGQFLGDLAVAVEGQLSNDWSGRMDLEVGLDLGVAEAHLRRSARPGDRELRAMLRRLVERRGTRHRTVTVFVDDIDLVSAPGEVLLQLRAIALELYAAGLTFAFVVAASPSLFAEVRAAHEPLVRFFQPLTLGPLASTAATEAITEPLGNTGIRFDPDVIAEIAELSGGRPYYLQKLAYFAFDAAVDGRVSRPEFAIAFERAFAAVSQEIFAARWAAMSPVERQVVSVIARSNELRPSGEIEAEAELRGIKPTAARQSLRRLAARGHIERFASGHRGRYLLSDRLFRRFLEMQTCER